jgi:hypothetical protein
MSRFRIYQINHYDPRIVGQKKRRTTVFYAAMTPVFFLLFETGVNLFRIDYLLIFLLIAPLITGFFLYFHFRLKSDFKAIKTIGDIEFTRTCIRKRIGDSLTEYDFKTIEELKLEKHIPATRGVSTRSGYFSYILRIVFNDASVESLVVSDKPINAKQDLCIRDTMRTLRKIVHPEITILFPRSADLSRNGQRSKSLRNFPSLPGLN